MSRTLVGFGGFSRAGKDTAADFLCRKYGFKKHGFSVALKEEVARCFRKTLTVEAERVYGDQLSNGRATLDEVIHRLLWTERTPITRALLQEYGSEVRRGDDPNYWTIQWIQYYLSHGPTPFVVQDVRFPNEIEAIRVWGGLLCWIERPGVGPESMHQSEQSVGRESGWHVIIENSGTLDDLYEKVERALEIEIPQARTFHR